MLIVAEEKEYIPEVLKPLPREEINSFAEDRNIVLENEVEDKVNLTKSGTIQRYWITIK